MKEHPQLLEFFELWNSHHFLVYFEVSSNAQNCWNGNVYTCFCM